MFKKIEIKENENKIYLRKYDREEYLKAVEKQLFENEEIITILKNQDNTYSVYNKEDLEEGWIINPIITFSEDENLQKVYYVLDGYIDNQKKLKQTIEKYEERIKRRNEDDKRRINSLETRLSNLEKLIYEDKEERKKIFEIIKKIIEDSNNYYECVDNYRYARIGDKYQEHLYQVAEERGCCGFYDKEIEVEGIKYKIGFNYGH